MIDTSTKESCSRKFVEISANQRLLLREPKAVSVLKPIVIPQMTADELSLKFRRFISFHDVLCTRLHKKKEQVYQEKIPFNEVKIRFHYSSADATTTKQGLQEKSLAFLRQPCDFFEGELIRVVAVLDELNQNIYLGVGIHYILIDMFSNIVLSTNLSLFFNNEPIQKFTISNFHFATWQKEFLKSSIGKSKRLFWLRLLEKNYGLNATHLQTYTKEPLVVSQSIFLPENFRNSLLKNVLVSINGVFMALYQFLFNKIFDSTEAIQLVRVSGRSYDIPGIDQQHLLGMLGNTLPLPVFSNISSFKVLCKELYSLYNLCISHQEIPLEIIKKDFSESYNFKLDSKVAGLYNFVKINSDKYQPEHKKLSSLKTQDKEVEKGWWLNLFVSEYNNGLQLELQYSKELHRQFKDTLNLKNVVKELIFSFLKEP